MYKKILSLVSLRPIISISLFLSLIVGSLLQGLSVAVIAPMIDLVTNTNGTTENKLALFIYSLMDNVGLSMDVGHVLFFALLLMISSSVISIYASWAQSDLKYSFDIGQKNKIYDEIAKVSPAKKAILDFGKIIYTVQNDTRLSSQLIEYFIKVTSFSLQLFVYLAIIFTVSWEMTLYTIFCGLIVYLLIKHIYKKAKKGGRIIGQISDNIQSNLNELLNGLTSLKVFNVTSILLNTQRTLHEDFKKTSVSLAVIESSLTNIFYPLALAIVASGYYLFEFSVSSLFVYVAAVLKLYVCVQSIQNFHYKLILNFVSLDRVESLINKIKLSQYENNTDDSITFCDDKNQVVRFKNISFSYDGNSNVLSDVNFNLDMGRKIAFVGGSGAGKSTLIDLLLGFLKPNSGKVLLNKHLFSSKLGGVDQFYHSIGYVPQDSFMLNGTIRENILFFRNFSEGEMIWALKISNAWGFVEELPLGLDTEVGENGALLSGGQKQRISLARALVSQPKLLILDEATSALDNISEAKIKDAIDNLPNTSVITVAHRLSTIKNYDQIYVLDDGVIVSHGDFDYLINHSPIFSDIYNANYSEE